MDDFFIYLDESGDLGFSFENQGTFRYFVISLLICRDKKANNLFRSAIRKTAKNKLKSLRELKGTNTSFSVKKYFYSQVSESLNWELYGIVLDKYRLKAQLKYLSNEDAIYNFLCKQVLRQLDLTKIKSRLLLVVDKRKNKQGVTQFNDYLTQYFKEMLPAALGYSISHEKSHENSALQAVDLFCWGIRRSYEYGDDLWRSVYEDRLTLIEVTDFSDFPQTKKRRPLKHLVPAF